MSDLDLNLIRTFVVLYETGSATLCAEKLNITQPSVSYGLARLRELFNDRLFVRSRTGMEPTAVADGLYEQLRQSLTLIENTVEGAQSFDAQVSEQRFTLALTDIGEMVQLPLIYRRIQQQAPNVRLKIVPLEIDKVVDWLSTGKVDAVVCSAVFSERQLRRRVVFQDEYVCLSGEPDDSNPLTLEAFRQARHIELSPTLGHSRVEQAMAAAGIKRDVVLSLPHFTALPFVLPGSNLLAIVPKAIARSYQQIHQLNWQPLPFEVPETEISIYWPSRNDSSPSQSWFVNTVAEALSSGW
ncbi:MAG: LysR family transcriptional regulator [Oceanobacter sp.]